MVFVYNEEKALENKTLYEKKRRNVSIIQWVLGVSGLVGAVVFIFKVSFDAPDWLGQVGVILMILSTALLINFDNSEVLSLRPPPDVTFYLAERKQDKRILNIKVQDCTTLGLTRKMVCLISENADGTVETTELCPAKYQESTKVNRVEFNVNEGIIYIPYKLESEEKESCENECLNDKEKYKQIESDEN